jgi:hypothetical protein
MKEPPKGFLVQCQRKARQYSPDIRKISNDNSNEQDKLRDQLLRLGRSPKPFKTRIRLSKLICRD